MTFEEYLAARGSALFRFAMVLAGQQMAAEDLLQATLIDAFAKWPRIAAAGNPDAYVRRLMINRHISRGRRRWTRELPSEAPMTTATDAPDIAIQVVERDQVREILSSLGPRSRTILVLSRQSLSSCGGTSAGWRWRTRSCVGRR